jgi:transposase
VTTAFRCRAYPDQAQQQVLGRTFGCVRVVWNRTLAACHQQYAVERTSTSYAETDRALTAMKKEPALAFFNEVSSVPPQQALRHQQAAFAAFFDKWACYPRFKSRRGRRLIVIDRWYPSSKTCSACGCLLARLSLSTRTWRCRSCGTRHDRDINAAKNILAAGLAVAA